MADLYGDAIGGGVTGNVDDNARKLTMIDETGTERLAVGQYGGYGSPRLYALKIVSATVNFSTTPTAANSNLYKAVTALQTLGEIYYVGVPGNTATGFVALVNLNKTYDGETQGSGSTAASANGSYEAIEDTIGTALGTAENDVTVTNVTLTGLTFS